MSETFGSDKHGPLHDDMLKAQTEGMLRAGRSTHAEEWRDPEPSGEDQPDVDAAPDGTLVGGTPDGMTAADVESRSELARHLGRVYPADRERLLEAARTNNAPAPVLGLLEGLPAGRNFANVQEVWAATGGGTEEHRF
jgi:hypothetical protein